MNITISKNTHSSSTRLFIIGKYQLPKEDWVDKSLEETISVNIKKRMKKDDTETVDFK